MEELYRLFPTELAKDGSKAKLLKYAVRNVRHRDDRDGMDGCIVTDVYVTYAHHYRDGRDGYIVIVCFSKQL